MKIKNSYVSFTGEINIGRYAYFIELDNFGIEINNDELVKKIINFSRVVILGHEPFNQKDELASLIKKCIKYNPNIVFEIFTNGTIKPKSLGSIDNTIYNVKLQLKHTGKEYKDRIKEGIVNWYNEIGANFQFNIKDKNDVDEVNLLVQEFGIKKSNVFLFREGETSKRQLRLLINYCKRTGYNFTLDFKKIFWEEEYNEQ